LTQEKTMKKLLQLEVLVGLILVGVFAMPSFGGVYANMDAQMQMMFAKQRPVPPALAFKYSVWRTAPLEVAKVFGRAPGCADADSELIEMTAKAAVTANLDPAILAATVATESACNPYAVSSRGAVGLTQIMPRIWSSKFDFAGTVNLFNREDNLKSGAQIEADLIAQYGTEGGLRHYNGMGTASADYDAGYTNKIISLAGRK
jgi:soluble lytic murein transglycosylase-like protein